ncbi:hypothetical protein PT108_08955, partial [Erysipelothrix rhusiopathiae]|nr:hypothetical protein [Erysipelothrix rhusiopathiae]
NGLHLILLRIRHNPMDGRVFTFIDKIIIRSKDNLFRRLFFKDGKPVGRKTGFLPKPELEKFIRSAQ